jgi:hypothetical protein
MNNFCFFVLNFLSTGVLPDIFSQDDIGGFFSALKSDMKIAGIQFIP